MQRIFSFFRRSLFLKVFSLAAFLSIALIYLVGSNVFERISNGIFEEKTSSAISQGRAVIQYAQYRFSIAGLDRNVDYSVIADEMVNSANISAAESGREVVLINAAGKKVAGIPEVSTSNFLLPEAVPNALREKIISNEELSWQRGDLEYVNGKVIPGIYIGRLIEIPNIGKYEMYVAYDFMAQQSSVDLIGRSLWGTGFLLMMLILLTASIVLRLVIKPVQVAAEVAESLTTGDLERRMAVKGEDEIARLGIAFNQMATTLSNQISKLENLSRVQQRFVSDVSHELRTPLTTIRMASDVIHSARSNFDPTIARSAELLLSQIEKFELLLQDLLEVSRFDAEAAILKLDRIDIASLVRRSSEDLTLLAEEKGTTLRLHGFEAPIYVDADSRRIERVVRNLITNSIDHSESKPIDISVAENENAVSIGVRDYGVGLAQQYWSRVFDRFWRADPSRSRIRGGTGLGLSIAKEDAILHGGDIRVWGEEGSGAHFVLTIPKKVGTPISISPISAIPTSL
ncbi:MAG: sensor histidine kinase [Actinobacteria bacterium]|nr:sensor histidine kinase [Actinomycetota bacterium]